jgi:alkaline phosphatase
MKLSQLCSAILLATTTLSACAFADNKAPKNIIMVIGDGMGPAYTTAYRYFHDDPATAEVEQTVFDRHLVGMSSTYPAPVSGYVTDSAAGATALSSGVKTYNGAVAVDTEKKPVKTVLEQARENGKQIGVVVTSQINHATPAGYLAHNDLRKHYDAIADSYFDEKINGRFKMDIILGGGWHYFIRDDRNLVNEFKQAGFQYLDNYTQLPQVSSQQPVLGLFADKGLPWALDDSNPHRLKAMTMAATKKLASSKTGFFMLIEGSQIDWAGHSNDIGAAMGEMDDLAATLEYLENFVQEHPDTLVVVTADHSTGGLSIAANGEYKWQPDVLRQLKHSPKYIADKLAEVEITAENSQALFNFALTAEELAELKTTKHDPKHAMAAVDEKGNPYTDKHADNVKKALYTAVKQLFDKRTNTGWTSSGHTAVDVPVFAFGSNAEQFKGLKDNTDIAHEIFYLLKQ